MEAVLFMANVFRINFQANGDRLWRSKLWDVACIHYTLAKKFCASSLNKEKIYAKAMSLQHMLVHNNIWKFTTEVFHKTFWNFISAVMRLDCSILILGKFATDLRMYTKIAGYFYLLRTYIYSKKVIHGINNYLKRIMSVKNGFSVYWDLFM